MLVTYLLLQFQPIPEENDYLLVSVALYLKKESVVVVVSWKNAQSKKELLLDVVMLQMCYRKCPKLKRII